MTSAITILHATKGRPQKLIDAIKLWAERATNPEQVEYVVAYEKEDAATGDALDAFLPSAELPYFEGAVVAIRGNFGGSAPAWNSAYQASTGSLLVQVSDDLIPPKDWDIALLNRLPQNWEAENLVIAVSDGLRRDRLLTAPICTRSYAQWKGDFLCPEYFSMYSDTEFSYRAYRDQEYGVCKVIEARDLTFQHDHHCIKNEAPDATYEWTNRPEAYAKGKALFDERNPLAYTKHAKLWL